MNMHLRGFIGLIAITYILYSLSLNKSTPDRSFVKNLVLSCEAKDNVI
jgi:hypothetical protein